MKFGHRRAEVPIQPVGRYRQPVLRVRGGLVAPLVPCSNAVLTHQPLHTWLALAGYPRARNSHTIRGET